MCLKLIPSRAAPELNPDFCGVRVAFSVVFCRSLFVIFILSIILSVLITVHYHFGIFDLFVYSLNNVIIKYKVNLTHVLFIVDVFGCHVQAFRFSFSQRRLTCLAFLSFNLEWTQSRLFQKRIGHTE